MGKHKRLGPWDSQNALIESTFEEVGDQTKELTGFAYDQVANVSYSIADTTGIATVEPVGDEFRVWVHGKEFIYRTAQTVTISKAEGAHMVYFDTEGVLRSTQDIVGVFPDAAFVFYTYWNADTDTSIAEGEERHGIQMSGATHLHLHQTQGAQYLSGLLINDVDSDADGNDDTSAYFSMSDGAIKDEDLENDTVASGQTLSLPSQIPVWYQAGAVGVWRKDAANNFPVKNFVGGDSMLAYNLDTAGTWSQAEVATAKFVLCHIFCTNEINEPVIAVQGQATYTSVSDARAGALTEITELNFIGLPVAEFVPLYTLIYQTAGSYSSTTKSRIRSDGEGGDYIDWRFQGLVAGAGGSGGGVAGPATSTDDAIVRFDGATGALLQNSTVTVSDTGVFSNGAEGLVVQSAAGGTEQTVVQFLDSAGSSKGYVGVINSQMIIKAGTDVAFMANANGSCELRQNNTKCLRTTGNGIEIWDPIGVNPFVAFYGDTNARLMEIEVTANTFKISKDYVSQSKFIFTGDATGAADLYYAQVKKISTLADGGWIQGALALDEITTPTPTADKGKVYTKTDNLLYFQDGAGTETVVALGIAGDVVGPASATEHGIARFDTTTGKLIQDSVVTISDAGSIALPTAGGISFANTYPTSITTDGSDSLHFNFGKDNNSFVNMWDSGTDKVQMTIKGIIMFTASDFSVEIGDNNNKLSMARTGNLCYISTSSTIRFKAGADGVQFGNTGAWVTSIETTLTDSDTLLPTSGAVVDALAAAGDVSGPASSTDNALARFDLTTGKLLQDSAVTMDDNGEMAFPDTYGITLGAGADIRMYWDNSLGMFKCVDAAAKSIWEIIPGSYCRLYYDGAQVFMWSDGYCSILGYLICDGLVMSDNDSIKLGAGQEGFIYSDGAALHLGSNTSDYMICTDAGSIEFRHNDIEVMQTLVGGIDITGELTVDQVNGLNAPDALGEAVRTTTNITEVNLLALTGAGETALHTHAAATTQIINTIQSASGKTAITTVEDGATSLYHNEVLALQTSTLGVNFHGTSPTDDVELNFISNDSVQRMQFKVNGNYWFLNLGASNEYSMRGSLNGSVMLYYDNDERFQTLANGARITLAMYLANATHVDKMNFELTSDTVGKIGFGVETSIEFNDDAAVELWYDNALRAETTSGGFKVTNSGATACILETSTCKLYFSNALVFQTIDHGLQVSDPAGAFFDIDIQVTLGHAEYWTKEDEALTTFYGENTASAKTTLIEMDPDGTVDLYHNGGLALSTDAEGILLTDGASTGSIIFDTQFKLLSTTNNMVVRLAGYDGGGVEKTLYSGNPGGSSEIYHAGVKHIWTNGAGITFTDGTDNAALYYASAKLQLLSTKNEAEIQLTATNTASATKDVFLGDPDGAATLYWAGSAKFATTTIGATLTGELIADQVTGLSAPDAVGEAVRTTTNITEANLEALVGGGETALHSHAA